MGMLATGLDGRPRNLATSLKYQAHHSRGFPWARGAGVCSLTTTQPSSPRVAPCSCDSSLLCQALQRWLCTHSTIRMPSSSKPECGCLHACSRMEATNQPCVRLPGLSFRAKLSSHMLHVTTTHHSPLTCSLRYANLWRRSGDHEVICLRPCESPLTNAVSSVTLAPST